MKIGYDVFGPEYGSMFRNDLHAEGSIDRSLLEHMILIDSSSLDLLYSQTPDIPDLHMHELYQLSLRFRGTPPHDTIRNVLEYTSGIASGFDIPFEEMLFGGTEKQILDRGTNWCTDMARVGCVLLKCLGIPCRMVYLADTQRAYNGHAICEAYYESRYGAADFIHGYLFHDEKPQSVYRLMTTPSCLSSYPDDYRRLFSAAAVADYDPTDKSNDYTISHPNEYYLGIMRETHHGCWFMGEDEQ